MATKEGKRQAKPQIPRTKDRKSLQRQMIQKNQIRGCVLINLRTRGRSQLETWKHSKDTSAVYQHCFRIPALLCFLLEPLPCVAVLGFG